MWKALLCRKASCSVPLDSPPRPPVHLLPLRQTGPVSRPFSRPHTFGHSPHECPKERTGSLWLSPQRPILGPAQELRILGRCARRWILGAETCADQGHHTFTSDSMVGRMGRGRLLQDCRLRGQAARPPRPMSDLRWVSPTEPPAGGRPSLCGGHLEPLCSGVSRAAQAVHGFVGLPARGAHGKGPR